MTNEDLQIDAFLWVSYLFLLLVLLIAIFI
jgi:hypothetical protein